MTTPRIEEKFEIAITNFVFSGLSIEKMDKIPKWLLENMEKNKPLLQKALTQAHQAGIDEAVEILESKKQIVSQHFLDKGDEEMVIRAILNHRLDDTIKALQDKK